MAKKFICIMLTLTLLVLSPISIFAEEKITGDFFIKNIKINGEVIVNYELQNSFFMYKNSIYMPLTPDINKICGLTVEMDWNSNTLKLTKTKSTQKNITDRWIKNDNKDMNVKTVPNAKVLVYNSVQQDSDVIGALDVGIKTVSLNGLPLLANGKNIFIPLKALTDTKSLGFDTYFDTYYGLCMSTNPGKSAKSYFSQAEANDYKGMAKYIQSYNKNLIGSKALEYVYLFKHASDVFGVDEKLLMAIAQKESKFNAGAVSDGGAVGMMQIMPKTAKTYGVSYYQLLDAKTNIEFGAMYSSNAIKRYSGNVIKGLSAYNQGGGSVDRGTHTTSYASRVLANQNSISNFVKSGKY